MSETASTCPDCSAPYEPTDNYCRQCGMYVAALRTVATIPPDTPALEPSRAGLPAPVRKAATAVAVGTALQIAVGLTGKYLARQAAKQAVATVRPSRGVRRPTPTKPAVAPKPVPAADPLDGAIAMSETLLIQRTWTRRR
jgi:hypothetical protein